MTSFLRLLGTSAAILCLQSSASSNKDLVENALDPGRASPVRSTQRMVRDSSESAVSQGAYLEIFKGDGNPTIDGRDPSYLGKRVAPTHDAQYLALEEMMIPKRQRLKETDRVDYLFEEYGENYGDSNELEEFEPQIELALEYLLNELPDDLHPIPPTGDLQSQIAPINNVDPSQIEGSRGLRWIENSCYFNAVIQALFNSGLRDVLHNELLHPDVVPKRSSLIAELDNLMGYMWADPDPSYLVVHTQAVMKQVWAIQRGPANNRETPFPRGVQSDAHEFLVLLLDELSELATLNNLPTFNKALAGSTRETRSCVDQNCPRQNQERVSPFNHLSLRVPQSTDPVSLLAILASYFGTERIDFVCDRPDCQSRNLKEGHAETKTSLAKAPPILILHLARFNKELEKVNTSVEIPQVFDFAQVEGAKSSAVYKLTSIIHHHGEILRSGHYTADVNHVSFNFWSRRNDEQVITVPKPMLSGPTPYILFFQQVL